MPTAPWDAPIADATALADGLLDGQPLPDELVARITARHGHRGYVEMALVVGFYRMVATFIAATGLEPEDEDVVSGWQTPAASDGLPSRDGAAGSASQSGE